MFPKQTPAPFAGTSRKTLRVMVAYLSACLLLAGNLRPISGQDNVAPSNSTNISPAELAKQVAELRELVQQLQGQVKQLQANSQTTKTAAAIKEDQTSKGGGLAGAPLTAPASQVHPLSGAAAPTASSVPTGETAPPEAAKSFDFLHGTTVNFLFDGYYGYNFNPPIGRVNLLRAYDVSSNAFSLNQADVVLENAPDPANGKRFGARVDLQFGQATETLQGNAANEPRPEIYRNIFQAYGTYVMPLGSGLAVDFGKWASSLGIEGNYTKDQMNYSRSYWFNFLPF